MQKKSGSKNVFFACFCTRKNMFSIIKTTAQKSSIKLIEHRRKLSFLRKEKNLCKILLESSCIFSRETKYWLNFISTICSARFFYFLENYDLFAKFLIWFGLMSARKSFLSLNLMILLENCWNFMKICSNFNEEIEQVFRWFCLSFLDFLGF